MDNNEPKTGVNVAPDGRRWWVPRLAKDENGAYLDAWGRSMPHDTQLFMREYEASLHDPGRYDPPLEKMF
ncbi:hypothetical protein D0B54_17880 [Solimonas sp. K1W22B-7]|uniref:hypothetical protein n=1 Tax=Solimonas sp. K1W22B-7 TaxID=2303331 RepID=UPI000E334C71|nr:hypothetical protein [Solimonas sp. K1W22B-7]AXQ30430.1 hypothetical protein D0B54_17880 [Solimonas sp. K1W22B-7]